jgi:hypothetical protein
MKIKMGFSVKRFLLAMRCSKSRLLPRLVGHGGHIPTTERMGDMVVKVPGSVRAGME